MRSSILYREYADTGDEQIRQLKDRLERASDALIDAVIDELFPETDTDGALDANAAESAQDVDL